MSDSFYWYQGDKVPLRLSPTKIAVKTKEPMTETIHESFNEVPNQKVIDLKNGLFLLEGEKESNLSTFALKAMSEETTYSVFETDDSTLIVTDELIVKFKPETTQEEMDTLNLEYAVRVKEKIEWEPNTYILTTQVGAQSNALETSNRYIESGKAVFAHPNFIRLFGPSKISDDSLSDQQWALNNTGQTGGIAGQDIRVLEAWGITKGHQDITIAILDEGVDYQHPDFQCANKLVTGFDAVTGSDNPAPQNNNAHGTACAGIAAGCIDNQTGISGVAPGCKIMGIRIAFRIGDRWETNDQQIASGIHTAFVRGADILSNSWGGGTPSDLITISIRRAKLEGRNGKGCVVCFAAGNDNSQVSYPGTLNEVITVAACNEYGERKSKTSRDGETWWGSNYGSEVDIAAPGVHILTTDISGAAGYTSTDYTPSFNGTSAATPHVAGVAALILSVNSELTAEEIKSVIVRTADDLEQPGVDEYTGAGRVNAGRAVALASKIGQRDSLSSSVWVGKFSGTEDQLLYFDSNNNWWLCLKSEAVNAKRKLIGNTNGFGGAPRGCPIWIGKFSNTNCDEILFYFPGDDNWWLGSYNGSELKWSLAGNTAGFGHGINDGRPFWVGDFNGDGKEDVLFYFPGDDNWWLGSFEGTELKWNFAGNTVGFGHGINDGRPFWTGKFSNSVKDEILFYFPGDDNWWLGSYNGSELKWSLAGNTIGFGHGINDGRPFWVGDFNGDGKEDVLFYFPGDDNWWLGSFEGTELKWNLAGNTVGFGHGINDGRPFWTGKFSNSVKDEILFYFPGDDNWWLGSYNGSELKWNLAGNTAGFGHGINDGRPFWIGDFNGDGKEDVLFYFPWDNNCWLGTYNNKIEWSLFTSNL